MIKVSSLLVLLVLTLLLTLILQPATLVGFAFFIHWMTSFGVAVVTFSFIKLATNSLD